MCRGATLNPAACRPHTHTGFGRTTTSTGLAVGGTCQCHMVLVKRRASASHIFGQALDEFKRMLRRAHSAA